MKAGRTSLVVTVASVVAASVVTSSASADAERSPGNHGEPPPTTTPIKHLVVIFQENVSFDHYFATYPTALNPPGEPRFQAAPGTPTVNGLSGALLTTNPNLGNPQRLDRSEALTCDQDHDYTAEQSAVDRGVMDRFVEQTGAGKTRGQCDTPQRPSATTDYAVMDHYDGNTVTALWNYAQRFAMSDNSFGTTYGPSTPGALNVIAANTFGAICGPSGAVYGSSPCPERGLVEPDPGHPEAQGRGTTYGDADPYFDACSAGATIQMGGRNIGDDLNAARSGQGLTWGFFEGGFASPGYVPGDATTYDPSTVCTSRHYNIGAGPLLDGQPCTSGAHCIADYSPHHQPFQYYRSTSNPQHLPPTSVASIGRDDQANHQYDLADFWASVQAGNMPAVSYLKAAKFEDGHAGYSDPLDEQRFLVNTLNTLQRSSDWESTAVVIAYDDSDGWYDHVMAPVLTQSRTALDTLSGSAQCGANGARVPRAQQARCGLGPRLPLLVISPFARTNFVDHSLTDQSSVVRFIEDNWSLPLLGGGAADRGAGSLLGLFAFGGPRPEGARLILDPNSGEPGR